MVATIHDITSALAYEGLSIREERAEAERQRLLTVVDSLPEGVLIIDANERVVLANRAAQAIVPMPAGALLDDIDRPLDLYYPDGRRYPPAEQPLRRAMREKRPIESAEIILHRPSQRIVHLLVNAAPLLEPDGQVSGGVSVFQDIHHLREVERMKDEFLSIASHELRTPVTALPNSWHGTISAMGGVSAPAAALMSSTANWTTSANSSTTCWMYPG
jgi:PAS domain S-box-containing protein